MCLKVCLLAPDSAYVISDTKSSGSRCSRDGISHKHRRMPSSFLYINKLGFVYKRCLRFFTATCKTFRTETPVMPYWLWRYWASTAPLAYFHLLTRSHLVRALALSQLGLMAGFWQRQRTESGPAFSRVDPQSRKCYNPIIWWTPRSLAGEFSNRSDTTRGIGVK